MEPGVVTRESQRWSLGVVTCGVDCLIQILLVLSRCSSRCTLPIQKLSWRPLTVAETDADGQGREFVGALSPQICFGRNASDVCVWVVHASNLYQIRRLREERERYARSQGNSLFAAMGLAFTKLWQHMLT